MKDSTTADVLLFKFLVSSGISTNAKVWSVILETEALGSLLFIQKKSPHGLHLLLNY